MNIKRIETSRNNEITFAKTKIPTIHEYTKQELNVKRNFKANLVNL